ncbi:MAG: DUF1801 domain-containing protein [Bacteroidia bacterium]|nr:DUF1801 domain-containing protein [Bacteroidia bacterium]
MQSTEPTVEAFLESLPPARKNDLQRLRALLKDVAPELRESMQYKMPTYSDETGDYVYAFNAQKHYLALYLRHIPEGLKPSLVGCNLGKGCIRFTRLDDARLEVFRQVLIETRHATADC